MGLGYIVLMSSRPQGPIGYFVYTPSVGYIVRRNTSVVGPIVTL